ncbi:MAG: 50S ribosomal protein L25/general stress protein Ctc [Flavobacteriales bacterium]|nr:MAG: 50S ribosomal protein L25/general stress protein Ctc [Flavobacteriales bacterium]
MKSVAISGNKREERGSAKSNLLRKEEKVPCVIYGGKENIHFTINEVKFDKIINTPEVYFIDLDVDGAKFKSIIKEIQFHPVTDRVLHIDFLEVFEDKALTVKIPVKITGRSIGIANGGTLRTAKKVLRINGLPSAIPENIEVDITELKIGQSIKVGEIDYPGLTFLGADNAVVVAVKMSRAVIEDEEEEGEGLSEEELAAMSEEERAEYDKAQAEKAAEGGEGGDKPAAEGGNKPAEGGGDGEAKKEEATPAE